MLKGMSKHLPTSLFDYCFPFILTTNLIEGCASIIVFIKKKDEVVEDIVEGEVKEKLSLLVGNVLYSLHGYLYMFLTCTKCIEGVARGIEQAPLA
jgi:hypothetical protein